MFSVIEPSVITHFPKRLLFSKSKTFWRSGKMSCLSNSVGREAGGRSGGGCTEQDPLRVRQHHPNKNQQGQLSGPSDIVF